MLFFRPASLQLVFSSLVRYVVISFVSYLGMSFFSSVFRYLSIGFVMQFSMFSFQYACFPSVSYFAHVFVMSLLSSLFLYVYSYIGFVVRCVRQLCLHQLSYLWCSFFISLRVQVSLFLQCFLSLWIYVCMRVFLQLCIMCLFVMQFVISLFLSFSRSSVISSGMSFVISLFLYFCHSLCIQLFRYIFIMQCIALLCFSVSYFFVWSSVGVFIYLCSSFVSSFVRLLVLQLVSQVRRYFCSSHCVFSLHSQVCMYDFVSLCMYYVSLVFLYFFSSV